MTPARQPPVAEPPGPTPPSHSTGTRRRPPRLGRQLAVLGFDIGPPIAVYLGAGAALPALSAAWTLALERHAEGVALFVLATMMTSITVSVIAHNPRFLLAKDGLITSLWGLWFLSSVRVPRPAAFLFVHPLREGRKIYAARDWDALRQAKLAFSRISRTSSVIWGTGMLADAAIRVVMFYTLPVAMVPGLGGALWPVTFVILQIITNTYYHFAGLNRILDPRWLNRPRPPPGQPVASLPVPPMTGIRIPSALAGHRTPLSVLPSACSQSIPQPR